MLQPCFHEPSDTAAFLSFQTQKLCLKMIFFQNRCVTWLPHMSLNCNKWGWSKKKCWSCKRKKMSWDIKHYPLSQKETNYITRNIFMQDVFFFCDSLFLSLSSWQNKINAGWNCWAQTVSNSLKRHNLTTWALICLDYQPDCYIFPLVFGQVTKTMKSAEYIKAHKVTVSHKLPAVSPLLTVYKHIKWNDTVRMFSVLSY